MKNNEKHICHYNSSQKILLVGEGNFSFSASLARAFQSAANMVATSFDSREMLDSKYPTSIDRHLGDLKKLGCLLLHKVDACKMATYPTLATSKFDRIIFNFPRAGHFGFRETYPFVIEKHRDLLLAFFKNSRELLSENGEVHVTHRDDHPYNRWEIEELAKQALLLLIAKVEFNKLEYPGYDNKRGGDSRSNISFPLGCGSAFTFKFALAHVAHKAVIV